MTAHLFVLAMISHPEAFRKAQEEVDRVCGASTMPTKEHIDMLPYMKAIMMEVSETLRLAAERTISQANRFFGGDRLLREVCLTW
jgi:hypothetical protein